MGVNPSLLSKLLHECKYIQMELMHNGLHLQHSNIFNFIYLFIFPFKAVPAAYGSSQARGRIGATAVSLCHSHSNEGSEPHLQPVLQLVVRLNPWEFGMKMV